MEFVVLILSVLAITFTVVNARSLDIEDHTKDGKNLEGDGNEQFKLMLPVAAYNLGDNYEIEIIGTLDLTHENFAAMLLHGVEENASCNMTFNYENNSRLVFSSELENDEVPYSMTENIIRNKKLNPEFILRIVTKNMFGVKMFIITFDHSEVGSCRVNSFDNLSYIIFNQGVKKIRSIKSRAKGVAVPNRETLSRTISRDMTIIDTFDEH